MRKTRSHQQQQEEEEEDLTGLTGCVLVVYHAHVDSTP